MRKILLFVITPLVVACGSQADADAPAASAKVMEPITLKGLATGQPVSDELKAAASAKDPGWTYFGAARLPSYKALADGTLVEISIPLENQWESYKLKDEFEKKMRAGSSPGFRFHCVSENKTVELKDARFAVSDMECYAHDEHQTLRIVSRHPRYKEPLLERFPTLKPLVDSASLTLYNKKLQEALAREERADIMKKSAKENAKAAADM